jgi:hypothetical protein
MLPPAVGDVNPISVMWQGNPVEEIPIRLYHCHRETALFRATVSPGKIVPGRIVPATARRFRWLP